MAGVSECSLSCQLVNSFTIQFCSLLWSWESCGFEMYHALMPNSICCIFMWWELIGWGTESKCSRQWCSNGEVSVGRSWIIRGEVMWQGINLFSLFIEMMKQCLAPKAFSMDSLDFWFLKFFACVWSCGCVHVCVCRLCIWVQIIQKPGTGFSFRWVTGGSEVLGIAPGTDFGSFAEALCVHDSWVSLTPQDCTC